MLVSGAHVHLLRSNFISVLCRLRVEFRSRFGLPALVVALTAASAATSRKFMQRFLFAAFHTTPDFNAVLNLDRKCFPIRVIFTGLDARLPQMVLDALPGNAELATDSTLRMFAGLPECDDFFAALF